MITASVTGLQDVLARVNRMTPAARAIIAKQLPALLIKMQSWIKETKLQHGTPLNRRTGTLSRSIHFDQQVTADAVIGRIYAGPEAPYARIHELGGTFDFHVPAHTRMIRQAFGRPIQPVQVNVQAFSYKATYKKRPFLRPALAAHRVEFQRLVSNAVAAAMKGATA
jgi:phage gpG-like protein